MSILHAAAECEAVTRLSTSVQESNGGGTFAAPARASIFVPAGQVCGQSAPWLAGATATGTFWLTWDWNFSEAMFGSAVEGPRLSTTGGMAFFRIMSPTFPHGLLLNVGQCQASNDGINWVNVGAPFSIPANVLYTMNLKATINSGAGAFALYAGDILIASATGINWSAAVNYGAWQWTGSGYPNGDFISKIVGTNGDDTRNLVLTPIPPNANGAHADEAGNFADVDELVLNDLAAASLAANGNKMTFTHAAAVIPDGHSCAAIILSGRHRVGAAGPQNGVHMLREGGVDYVNGANIAPAMLTAYGPRQSIWTLDPATGLAFAAIPAEFGLEAIT